MRLNFTNSVTKKEYNFTVEDKNLSRILYCFDITLPKDIDEGTYNYFLYDETTLIAQGIAQIGDYKNNPVTYTTNGTYIQYEP